ncbi:endonuclease domain-containing protein [Microvirga sp. CF3062]|jgi:very-short-patch-repair endonuclease|uniref:endonuclease domain-containing protein n=1 Tax=Microvirga sp. CF3062 TaxID=3110182 RepID=UPI002E75BD96|nr:endonuclease domain-containing protein [Microvirga sp. CF3062]MEE1657078.1 endonuclease domain-containing protein [Microvirga sp. CF3062]
MTREPRQFARNLRKTLTSAEDVLWQALRGRRFHRLKFRRQVPFLNYTVDFLCVERKLIVEIDGKQHEWYAEYDSRRTKEIEHHGFKVIRFTNYDVMNDLESVLLRIAEAAVPPAASLPHPWPLSHSGEGKGA